MKAVNLAALKSTLITIYICIPAMRLATCGRLFRMMVQLVLAALERDTTKPKYRVRLVMDEFAAYDKMTSISKAIGQIAGLDCQMHIILQDLLQIQDIYDKRAESFIANAGIIQTFGLSDNTTLHWLEQRLGATTILVPSLDGMSGEMQKDFEARTWQAQSHPLMTAEEISRCFAQQDELLRQLVIVPGLSPFVLQRSYYDKHEMFQESRK